MPGCRRMTLPAWLEPVGHGIHVIDTGMLRPRAVAAYLLVHDGRAAFIDTGTQHTLPRHLEALRLLGVAHDAVDYVIPTHVHLDHAGGAGALMQALPRATLVVHPHGARHLIDPTALWAGATSVYGADEMMRSYGTAVPVPADRVRSTHDGMLLHLGGRALRFIDTPGHARHHHCIWDEASRGWFTGDTFGISYREFDLDGRPWIFPTAAPAQFEPELLPASVQRLLDARPAAMYLTHFGRVGDVQRLGRVLLPQIEQMAAIGRRCAADSDRHQRLKRELHALYAGSLAEHGLAPSAERMALLEGDIELNAQGIGLWLDRLDRRARKA
jgi:glyoxylase-like metal-dependent hydrolase (beta-lactamase superfamily II)